MPAETYLIVTRQTDEQHAGSKARQDIERIAAAQNVKAFVFNGNATGAGRLRAKLMLAWQGVGNWLKLLFKIESGATVLMQYPPLPVKSAYFAYYLMPVISRIKKVRFVAIIHDLNSARNVFGSVGVFCDEKLLRRFDAIVCHNDEMKLFLQQKGYGSKEIVCLGLFDYLTSAPLKHAQTHESSVIVAGNLSAEKSGYLNDFLKQSQDRIKVHLYGPDFEHTANHSNVIYHGSYPPDELPSVLDGAYGLVWDGDRTDTCAGAFGEYQRLNNPHKVSLYLSSGIPVIIWDQAALKDLIVDNHLGVAIPSLDALPAVLGGISGQEYGMMCENVARQAILLRNGTYTAQAIETVRAKGKPS